jgi:hypothetical protein
MYQLQVCKAKIHKFILEKKRRHKKTPKKLLKINLPLKFGPGHYAERVLQIFGQPHI